MPMISLYTGSFLGLLMISAAHLFVRQAFRSDTARGMILDVLTGVAIAYAFVDVFPHLAGMQAKLEATAGSALFSYLAHHVYLMALLGFLAYLGLKTSLDEELPRYRARPRLLLLLASMTVYSFLIGYMLSEQPTHRPEPAILFGAAMGAHLLGLNYENRRLDPDAYDRYSRYLLVAGAFAGWLTGVFFEMSDAVYALWFAFLAGGIVAAGVATELPRVRSEGAFISFTFGALLFSVLLLLIETFSI